MGPEDEPLQAVLDALADEDLHALALTPLPATLLRFLGLDGAPPEG